ncbi:MAG: sodium:alanine symporter family protein [Synergistaceae bacterium]|nr:sodium:alanine symporter family protein [Synergistaceae bacterium]
MGTIMEWNDYINGIVWGWPMLILIVGTGIYLTLILGFPQVRYFAISLKQVFGKNKSAKSEGSISSFAALSTALAATVGTGNIAGVATALNLGGPGALFWMLVSAVFGMATKFAEVALAVKFRDKDAQGNWRGGTMHVLEQGIEQKWIGKTLAWFFALFAFLASFGIGCAVQATEVAKGMKMGFDIPMEYTGIVLALLVAAVIIGGLKSLATVTTLLVPAMAVFYIIGGTWVVIEHASLIPQTISNTVNYAFNDPMAMPGAIAGWAVMTAVRRGIARGVFSNEAGLGSAPMVHATATVDHPVRQGLYGIFEVFADTIIICTLTALAILLTGALTTIHVDPETGKDIYLTGAQLSLSAYEMGLGATVGKVILPISLSLFAFTTILGWFWYSETAAVYIFGTGIRPVVKILFIGITLLGACGGELLGLGDAGNTFLNNLWDIADTLNGLMAIPNLIALLLLSGVLIGLVKDFDAKRKSGELKI